MKSNSKLNLLNIPLNTKYHVENGGYDAYVIEKDGRRFVFCHSVPCGCMLWEITQGYSDSLVITQYVSNEKLENAGKGTISLLSKCLECKYIYSDNYRRDCYLDK